MFHEKTDPGRAPAAEDADVLACTESVAWGGRDPMRAAVTRTLRLTGTEHASGIQVMLAAPLTLLPLLLLIIISIITAALIQDRAGGIRKQDWISRVRMTGKKKPYTVAGFEKYNHKQLSSLLQPVCRNQLDQNRFLWLHWGLSSSTSHWSNRKNLTFSFQWLSIRFFLFQTRQSKYCYQAFSI